MPRTQSTYLDSLKSAKNAGLKYITDQIPGITRKRKGKKFIYFLPDGKLCKDDDTLIRIKSLAIPPAWNNVWICPLENGHLQATGIDNAGRKQYKYHTDWQKSRGETKYKRLLEFGRSLPLIRATIRKNLNQESFNETKVLALIVCVMEKTFMRIGNNAYEKLYGSYGLTTLRDKHIKINGDTIIFSFIGKKGIAQNISLHNKRLSNLIMKCKDLPGYELFQYIDEKSVKRTIGSADVNRYLKNITGCDFTAKDFRTWAGTINGLHFFKKCSPPESQYDLKRKLNQMIDYVAQLLGNTRKICKKYYIHPVIIQAFQNGVLPEYFRNAIKDDRLKKYRNEEKILLTMLEKSKINMRAHKNVAFPASNAFVRTRK